MATEQQQQEYLQGGQQFGENIASGFNGLVDAYQGNMLAQAYTDQAIAEAQAGVATKFMADGLKPLDGLFNAFSGGQWAEGGHSFYLGADEFGDNLINSASQHSEMANTGYMGGGVSGIVETEKATKDIDYAAEFDQHMEAHAENVKQSIADVTANAKQSISEGFANAGQMFTNIPNDIQNIMQKMQENGAVDNQFGDGSVTTAATETIKGADEAAREVVDKSTVDFTSATPSKDLQAGA